MIQRPKDGQPAFGIGGRKAGEVRGVDHQDRVKLEPDRTWLDVAHAGQQQRRQQITVTQAAFQFRTDFLEQPFARCVFQETHQRLDLGVETNDVGIQVGFLGRNRAKLGQETKFPQTG